MEIFAPQPVAEERDGGRIRPVVLGFEHPAQRGMNAEQREQAGTDTARLHAPRLRASGEIRFLPANDVTVTADLLEDVRLSRPLVVLGGRKAELGEVGLVGGPDSSEPRGIAEGKRTKQHGIDDGEYGGVGADAERERENYGENEDRRAAEHIVSRFWFLVSSYLYAAIPVTRSPITSL